MVLEEPESDLASLWQTAVEDYEKRTKKSLRLAPFKSIQDVMTGTEGLSNNFKDFRHDKSKTDKVRTAFKNNLWLIQKVVSTVQMVGNTASAFPPAMPASLIFSAFGQVMQTFGQMSADYDKILAFFDFTHRFLDRLSIIQDKTPKMPQLRRCIVHVFSSMLTICSIAQEYVKEKRMKKWFNTLLDGSDSSLVGAYKDMEAAINELSQAVQLATLRTVEVIAELVQSLTDDVEFIVTKVTVLDERTHAIHSDTQIIVNQNKEMASKQDVISTKQDKFGNTQDAMFEMMKNIKQYTESSRGNEREKEKERDHPGQKKPKGDPADKRREALKEVKAYFKQKSSGFESVSKEAKMQKEDIGRTFVHGTGSWLLSQDEFLAWDEARSRILWLHGIAGVGKSFLAYAADLHVRKGLDNRKGCASAYFLFREDQNKLRSWDQALYSMAFQIAEKDPRYAERLASKLSSSNSDSPWMTLFAEMFKEKSDGRVYLVIDGLDEMSESERDKSYQSLRQINDERLNIHVLLASRPELPELDAMNLPRINVTTTKLAVDIQKVIVHGIRSLPRLKKFSKPVKAAIIRKLRRNADGMRYVEHMLRRLSYIGREKAVLADLETNLPKNLTELYQLMLEECQKNRTNEQYRALKKLFAWLAYSKRALTLGQASELVALTVQDGSFDIEDELIGRSARILELAQVDYDEDEQGDDLSDDVDESNAEAEIGIKDSGSVPLTFQERSLREYFQAVDVDENGLRTAPSAAHQTIFEMAGAMLFRSSEFTRPVYSDEPMLMDYAAEYWIKHFMEIDLSATTDIDVAKVVSLFYKVLNNHSNTARTVEYFSNIAYSEIFPEDKLSWLNKFKEWTARAAALDSTSLPMDVQEWAKDFTVEEALIPLARGHVENWYQEVFGPTNSECFRFARDALSLSNSDVDVTPDTLETILYVADKFPDIVRTAGAMRAISATLSLFNLPEDAKRYADQGLEMLGADSSALRFYLARSIALSSAKLENYEEALSLVDKAILAIPENWKDDQDLLCTVEDAYSEKAQYLQILGRADEAIATLNESRRVNPKLALSGWLLDDITRVLNTHTDPHGEKLLALLGTWNEKETLAWFEYIFGFIWIYEYPISRLDQIAGLPDSAGKDLVLRCYDQYLVTLSSKPEATVVPRAALANCYRTVLDDDPNARKLYEKISETSSRDYDMSDSAKEKLSEARNELADMIFTEFRSSTHPARKSALLQQFQGLPTGSTEEQPEMQAYQSNASVMAAMMMRVMGPTTQYQIIMQKIFDISIDGLSDSVGWNDGDCFRLLAKVLSCVKGLEREALIALSLQFSRVTEVPEEEVDEKDDERGVTKAKTNTELAVPNGDGSETPEKNPQNSQVGDQDSPSNNIHVVETTITSTTVEDGRVKENSTIIIEEVRVDGERTPDAITGAELSCSNTSSERIPPPPDDETTKLETLPPIEDEDLEEYWIHCNGECSNEWDRWETPLYLCIFCANCDLCPACHAKRMAQNNGEPRTFYRSYCGKNHRYIKGPASGWRGVKNGVMGIQRDDGSLEEIEVKKWLKDLKEKAWVEAWDKIWLGLSDVRDIGF